jgi:hypothetical protein
MDEPFAALDALTRRKTQEELVALWDDVPPSGSRFRGNERKWILTKRIVRRRPRRYCR